MTRTERSEGNRLHLGVDILSSLERATGSHPGMTCMPVRSCTGGVRKSLLTRHLAWRDDGLDATGPMRKNLRAANEELYNDE